MEHLKYVNRLSRQDRLYRLAWGIASTVLFRPTPRWTLHGWRRTLLRLFGARIGKGCRIDPSCRIWAPRNLAMGQYSALGPDVDCYNVATITIGSKVTVSQRAFLCTASHDIESLLRPLVSAPISVADHAWIAADAMVHPGVDVARGAVIAARAVLTRPTEPWRVYVGVPARMLARRRVRDGHLDPEIARELEA